ncbi:tRNA (guanine(46)-N(7))-methyltransferase TrmB [Minwuia thermotolerans]|uniref:tRNA (guanine-N(7)-)-methyltransferase n=1 Tax=Minwuia thermotolerans TaxID=2056226 RepID=A0A2M9G242_9PROT|nr:tRNA (guanine(46)-N(7))-methyltransferase TrmB [Minwuia thermotolerans]PJK29788.1 tRNA (guanosine(46)-N7)-methyltransferase TrmB [Minwuia thermotolerans]
MGRADGPPYRFYGRRRGKRLSPRQERLIDDLLPRLAPDPARLPAGPLWLEIGSGGGEHLTAQAADHPEATLIGCEPFLEGVAKTLGMIEDEGLGNVLLLDDDVRPLLDGLPDSSVDRCFILFPDPWPKLRHHKRRIVSRENLDSLARVLKPGADLRIATDHMDYARWILRHLLAHPDFDWPAERPGDWRLPPAGHRRTRYEAKALEKGDRPLYFRFTRNT